MNNKILAEKIFDHLNSKGAGLGNISIVLIQNVLDKELNPESNLQSNSNNKEMEDYEFNLHKHWKEDESSNDDHGGTIKHFGA